VKTYQVFVDASSIQTLCLPVIPEQSDYLTQVSGSPLSCPDDNFTALEHGSRSFRFVLLDDASVLADNDHEPQAFHALYGLTKSSDDGVGRQLA
jgi:hypothetical protein